MSKLTHSSVQEVVQSNIDAEVQQAILFLKENGYSLLEYNIVDYEVFYEVLYGDWLLKLKHNVHPFHSNTRLIATEAINQLNGERFFTFCDLYGHGVDKGRLVKLHRMLEMGHSHFIESENKRLCEFINDLSQFGLIVQNNLEMNRFKYKGSLFIGYELKNAVITIEENDEGNDILSLELVNEHSYDNPYESFYHSNSCLKYEFNSSFVMPNFINALSSFFNVNFSRKSNNHILNDIESSFDETNKLLGKNEILNQNLIECYKFIFEKKQNKMIDIMSNFDTYNYLKSYPNKVIDVYYSFIKKRFMFKPYQSLNNSSYKNTDEISRYFSCFFQNIYS